MWFSFSGFPSPLLAYGSENLIPQIIDDYLRLAQSFEQDRKDFDHVLHWLGR
jgi:hypothetical protein